MEKDVGRPFYLAACRAFVLDVRGPTPGVCLCRQFFFFFLDASPATPPPWPRQAGDSNNEEGVTNKKTHPCS